MTLYDCIVTVVGMVCACVAVCFLLWTIKES